MSAAAPPSPGPPALVMPLPPGTYRIGRGYRLAPRAHPVDGEPRPHKGVDLAAPTGTPVLAAAPGTVEKAQVWSGDAAAQPEGTMIRIVHAGEWRTRYFHLSAIAPGIVSGARVEAGTVIGAVGTTGRSTGAHLHFELTRPDWVRADPAPALGIVTTR